MKYKKTCPYCQKEFEIQNKSTAKLRKFCSKTCATRNQIKNTPKEKQPAWKGGFNKHSAGYINIRIGNKYFLYHRYLMEKHLNRKLKRSEDVHHINGIKHDNRIENLIVMTKAKHASLHYPSPCPRVLAERFPK